MNATLSNEIAIGETALAGENRRYETVDGLPVEKEPMSKVAVRIAAKFIQKISNYLDEHGEIGIVGSDGTYFLEPAGKLKRRPDVAYLSAERYPLAESAKIEGDFPVPPDIAVEIASTHNGELAAQRKIREYLTHGVKEVWSVNPELREILVYFNLDQVRLLTENKMLTSDLLPGFSIRVGDLFPKV